MAIDGYLLARDMGVIDDSISREEFERIFNKGLAMNQPFTSTEEVRENIWNNDTAREQVLAQMDNDPSFAINYQGRQVRLDRDGNMYDYDQLLQYDLGVNTQGDIYDISTGKILNDANKEEFIIGRM